MRNGAAEMRRGKREGRKGDDEILHVRADE